MLDVLETLTHLSHAINIAHQTMNTNRSYCAFCNFHLIKTVKSKIRNEKPKQNIKILRHAKNEIMDYHNLA